MSGIEVRDLRKTFGHRGEVVALDGVSFAVEQAGALGLIGESGSGKSTTARILLGLEKPTSGEVLRDSAPYEPWRASGRQRLERARSIQIVFQDPYLSLNPRLRIIDAVRAAAELHGLTRSDAEKRARELLDEVGLGIRESQSTPRALSGGQRQRAAIARALAVRPRFLILDEAVAALDVSVQAQILNLLNELRRAEGVGFLFITHNLAVVRYVTDEAVVLHRGRIVERGPTERVLSDPHDPYTRALLAAVPGSITREDPR